MAAVIAALREFGLYGFILTLVGCLIFLGIAAINLGLSYVCESRTQRAIAVRRSAIRALPAAALTPSSLSYNQTITKTESGAMQVLYGSTERSADVYQRDTKIVMLNARWHDPAAPENPPTHSANVVNLSPFYLN